MRVDVDGFEENGYALVRGLFAQAEVAGYLRHYMDLRANGSYPDDFAGVADGSEGDPWQRFPRMIHMQRWDERTRNWLLDARLAEVFRRLLGKTPYAVQTMAYFKPPGARGQALHQDQYYLRVQPGTCIAAWMALEDCDEENGCLQVVPGSHRLPLICPQPADTAESFTDIAVPLSAGMQSIPMRMRAGDVLFFNGQVIHGSYPNRSASRFRRSLVGHYIDGDARQVSAYHHPVLRFDGTVVELGISDKGGECGVWVEAGCVDALEMSGSF